jgi:RNA polymerase sigma-70 factor (ECF subfamily)
MAVDETDAALLEAARGGERSALDRLLARHIARIHRFGTSMCRDPEDAKEVVQDTLLAAARSIREFRGGSSFSTWLFSIARSFCIKRRRRGKSAPAEAQSSEAELLTDPAQDLEAMVETKEIGDALERAIAALDPKYREVLLLRDVEGLTAPEVAAVVGIGVDAVKTRLHRARLAVRAAVAPRLGVAEGRDPGCPDVLASFSRHLEDELSADVCAEMERHLLRCPQCRSRCDSLRRTLALCRAEASVDRVPPAVSASVRAALRDFLARPK